MVLLPPVKIYSEDLVELLMIEIPSEVYQSFSVTPRLCITFLQGYCEKPALSASSMFETCHKRWACLHLLIRQIYHQLPAYSGKGVEKHQEKDERIKRKNKEGRKEE